MGKSNFNIFDENHEYEILYPTGATKRLEGKEEIEKYLLNPANPIPEVIGRKTWISNYVLTFWMPIMGVGAFTTYLQLTKMAYGEKEYAYPTGDYIAMMMGVSKRTVQTYMRKLQDLNFVVVIHVKHKRRGSLQNLYLLSRTVPFLTDKQLELLPERLRVEHEEFITETKDRKLFD